MCHRRASHRNNQGNDYRPALSEVNGYNTKTASAATAMTEKSVGKSTCRHEDDKHRVEERALDDEVSIGREEIDHDFHDVCQANDNGSPRNRSTSGDVECADDSFEHRRPRNRHVETRSGGASDTSYSAVASIISEEKNTAHSMSKLPSVYKGVLCLTNEYLSGAENDLNQSNSSRPIQSNSVEIRNDPTELVASSSEHSQTCDGRPTEEVVQETRLDSAVTTSKNCPRTLDDDDDGLQPGAYRVATRAHGAVPAWARIRQAIDGNDNNDDDDDIPPEMRRPQEPNEDVTPEEPNEDVTPEMRQHSTVSSNNDSEENLSQPFHENDPALTNPPVTNLSVTDQLVAARVVDTQEEEQRIQELEAQSREEERRIQELEAQNRMLREREQNVVEAHVVSKSEILKSFFDLRDPEFRRQRLCAFGFIFLALAASVLGVVLTKNNGTPANPPTDAPTEAPTMAPTPEPTSEGLGNLTLFLSSFASFDGGASLINQSTPQYKAAKWLANNNTRLVEYSKKQTIQRYVLATLYFSTDGDNWMKNTNWLDDGDECRRWFQSVGYDITCTAQNDTRRILLKANGLKGPIPPELAFLSDSLERIELPQNALTGTVPTELALLTVLKSLNVDDNILSGMLMTELGLLTKLYYLGMASNKFAGAIPDELYLLTNLRK
jgi:TolA-binding protein